jgi:hypothetical protein
MMSPTMLQSVMKGPGRQAIEDEYSLDPADFLDRHIFDYESWLPDHGWDLSTATLAAVGRGYQREPRADALQLANEYVLAKAVIST